MTKDGLKSPNYFGSLTQASTLRVGNYEGEEVYVPFKSLLPMVGPCARHTSALAACICSMQTHQRPYACNHAVLSCAVFIPSTHGCDRSSQPTPATPSPLAGPCLTFVDHHLYPTHPSRLIPTTLCLAAGTSPASTWLRPWSVPRSWTGACSSSWCRTCATSCPCLVRMDFAWASRGRGWVAGAC